MQEITPGIWHWMRKHPHIGVEVSSYYLEQERVLLDPMIPAEGLAWFQEHSAPKHIVMTNRHHDRDSWDIRETFGCTVHCIRNGLHEVDGRGPVKAFDFGDVLPGNAVVYEIGVICPDETALHLPDHNALSCADGVIHYGEELGFVPEQFMDDPENTKKGLRRAYQAMLDLDFDVLLVAHGQPKVGGAKEALRRFTQAG